MKCENEWCEEEVPEANIDRVCAYLVEPGTLDYTGCRTCNCCDFCRNECHNAALHQDDVLF